MLSEPTNTLVKEERETSQSKALKIRQVFRIDLEDILPNLRMAVRERVIAITQKRLQGMGRKDIVVQGAGDTIVVEIPGSSKQSAKRIAGLVSRDARFSIQLVDEAEANGRTRNPYMKKLYGFAKGDEKASEGGITQDIGQWVHPGSGRTFVDYFLRAETRLQLFSHDQAAAIDCPKTSTKIDPKGQLCPVSGRTVLAKYLRDTMERKPEMQIDEAHQFGYEFVTPFDSIGKPYWRTYYLYREIPISNEHIETVSVAWDKYNETPIVHIAFTPKGGKRFAEFTGNNVGRKVAIVLGGIINSAPTIQSPITGGATSLTVGGSDSERDEKARELASILNAGPLPVRVRFESQSLLSD